MHGILGTKPGPCRTYGSQKWDALGHLGAMLGHGADILGHLTVTLGHPGITWSHLVPTLGHFEHTLCT